MLIAARCPSDLMLMAPFFIFADSLFATDDAAFFYKMMFSPAQRRFFFFHFRDDFFAAAFAFIACSFSD